MAIVGSSTPTVDRRVPGLVSVIVIFLDAERFLAEALDSILAQTWDRWEILLVDDGSTDRSTTIAREYERAHADRIRYLEHPGHANRGMSASRNLGLAAAAGEYVAFLDADDVWLPRKLERQVALLERFPEAGMVCGPTEYWYGWTGRPEDLQRDGIVTLGVPEDALYHPPELLSLLYPLGQHPAPCNCSWLIKRKALERVGGFEESFTGFYEDQALLSKIYATTPVYVSSECWDRYRVHPWSCSAQVERSGDYRRMRGVFLRWLKAWLDESMIDDPAVAVAMANALRDMDGKSLNWLLRAAAGNVARLVYEAGEVESVRVEIARSVSAQPYDTQLNLPGFAVEGGEEYSLSFEARADEERNVGYGLALARSPWSNLGLYGNATCNREWRRFEERFKARSDADDARVHFDLGCDTTSVEFRAVAITRVRDGRRLIPEPPGRLRTPGTPSIPDEPRIPVGKVDFGALRRLTPISSDFGTDRGRPVDRYYIERFLETHAGDVHGRVLEIGDNEYTLRFGGDRVTISDILHVTEGEPSATIIADLAQGDNIPSETFDCVIITQTLQLIYDLPAAIRTLHRILKPGGVVLATVPGISQSYDYEWSGTWYWSFTRNSARCLFSDVFGEPNVTVEAFGNVLAAAAFLYGLAAEELTDSELGYNDPGYGMTVAIRARKITEPERRVARGDAESAARPPMDGPDDSSAAKGIEGSAPPLTLRRTDSRLATGVILMYHRIADEIQDPFSLAVSPRNFAEQLEVLSKHTRISPLSEIDGTGAIPSPGRPRAFITFDDGYADNLHVARPVLERADAPATVFIATGWLGSSDPFWWDELEALLLGDADLPPGIIVTTNDSVRRFTLTEPHQADAQSPETRLTLGWKVAAPPPTARHAAYIELWRTIQPLLAADREAVMEQIREGCGRPALDLAGRRTLAPEEVVRLADGGLVEIGCHTVTHPLVDGLASSERAWEIRTASDTLRDVLGAAPTSFSYPFNAPREDGNMVSLLRGAGFRRACTSSARPLTAGADPYRLPRLQVGDWAGDEFEERLLRWLAGSRVEGTERTHPVAPG